MPDPAWRCGWENSGGENGPFPSVGATLPVSAAYRFLRVFLQLPVELPSLQVCLSASVSFLSVLPVILEVR